MTTNSNYNVLVIGDHGVGKTSFINRFINDSFVFKENSKSFTVGVNDNYKKINLSNDEKVLDEKVLKVIDTDGDIKTNSTSFKNACKTAHGVIIVYDITNKTSFENVSEWLKKIKDYNIMPDTVIYLIGNKSDLDNKRGLDNKRQVQSKDATEWPNNNLISYKTSVYETSVKNNTINHIFPTQNKSLTDESRTLIKQKKIDHIFTNIAEQIKNAKQLSRPDPSCCSIS